MRGSTEIGPLPRRDTRQLADQGGPPMLAGAPPASSIPRTLSFPCRVSLLFVRPRNQRASSLSSLFLFSPPRSSCFFSRDYFNLGLATRSTAPEPSTFHRPPGCRRATTSLAPAEGTGMQMLAPAETRRISTGRSLTKQLARGVAYTAAGNIRGEQAAWRTEFKAAEP